MRNMIPLLFISACLAGYGAQAQADYSICPVPVGTVVDNAPFNYQTITHPSGRQTRVAAGNHAYAPSTRDENLLVSFCGPWLDLTHRVEVSGSGLTRVRTIDQGVRDRGRRNEQAYITVLFKLAKDMEPGLRTIRLHRPSLTGGDSTSFRIDVRRNIRLHSPAQPLRPIVLELANNALDHNFSIAAEGANKWIRGVKPRLPANGVFERLTITSRRGDTVNFSARVRLPGGQLDARRFFNDYLELTTGTDVIDFFNTAPGLATRTEIATSGASSLLSARDSGARTGTPQRVIARGPIRLGGEGPPNLLPVLLFPERPLIRRIGGLRGNVMVSPGFCSGLANNQAGTGTVPSLVWGVSSAGARSPSVRVELRDGRTNALLSNFDSGPVNANDAGVTRENYPGRPTQLRVVNVVDGAMFRLYGQRGCFLDRSAPAPRMDPEVFVLAVDTNGVVDEGQGEADNELRF